MDITLTLHNYQWYSGKKSWLWPFPVASRGGTGARCMWNRYVFALVWLIITSVPILTSLTVKRPDLFPAVRMSGFTWHTQRFSGKYNWRKLKIHVSAHLRWCTCTMHLASHKMTVQSQAWLYGYSMNEDILLNTDRAISIAMSSSSELLDPRSTLYETSLT